MLPEGDIPLCLIVLDDHKDDSLHLYSLIAFKEISHYSFGSMQPTIGGAGVALESFSLGCLASGPEYF